MHQFDHAGADLGAIQQQWPGRLYVKALDGTTFMSYFDTNHDHVTGYQGGDQWDWVSQNITPWTVPTDDNPEVEGIMAGHLAEKAGGIILDLEPYAHFWHGNAQDAETFMRNFRAIAPDAPLAVTLDHRRYADSAFPPVIFLAGDVRLIPQVYWTDFEKPWKEVLDEAYAVLAPTNIPIEMALPGNAEPADFAAALAYCLASGWDVSVWVYQSVRPENLEALRQIGTQQAPAPDCADYINLLGYLQGDVAAALKQAVKRPSQAFRDALYALTNTGQGEE